jgi:hypothetical protein
MWEKRVPALVVVAALMAAPVRVHAWGANAQRLIASNAVGTLPPEMRSYFEANRQFIVNHTLEPLDLLQKNPVAEFKNHYLFLDHYGTFPFDSLPRNYKAAVAKFGKTKLEASGVLPWQIGVWSEKLTTAFRERDWQQVRLASAWLSVYVAQAHDPFHTTENYDGRLSGQPRVDVRFGTSLVDRYSTFFPMRPNDAFFLPDPTYYAFENCLSAHAWVENILLADRRARAGLSDYTDEYYDHFYNLAGAIVIRQLSDAATDVGSFWMTAWTNAGKPQLPPQ